MKKPKTNTGKHVAQTVDFFDPVNLKKTGVDKLTKKELIKLIAALNKQMIASLSNWDGG